MYIYVLFSPFPLCPFRCHLCSVFGEILREADQDRTDTHDKWAGYARVIAAWDHRRVASWSPILQNYGRPRDTQYTKYDSTW